MRPLFVYVVWYIAGVQRLAKIERVQEETVAELECHEKLGHQCSAHRSC